ncbi:MAG: BBP7 family outer membrane beta-barrel protein [Planctomycetaceae bacterium]|nr:BBP7 family outer membrane beta-barrel protein [Planctomycetaceae bacterium]
MTRWYPVVLLALLGWTTSSAIAQGPYVPGGMGPGYFPGPPNPGMYSGNGFGPAYTQELVPDVYDQFGRAGQGVQRVNQGLSGAWIRTDYLLWDISRPGDKLIGAPMATQDANSAFSAFDPVNGIRLDAQGLPVVAIVPNLAGTQLRNTNASIIDLPTDNRASFDLTNSADTTQLNGARISAGVPIGEGVFEAEAWALQEAQSDITFNPTVLTLSGVTLIPALTLLDGGLPSDSTMILFSESYQTVLSSNLWGTEGNWAFANMNPGSNLQITPLLGFRYARFGEKMSIAGADIPDPINFPGTVLNHRIHSSMSNHIFGPQVGLKMQYVTPFVTVGFEPKLAATVNRATQDLSTQQIYQSGIDPVTLLPLEDARQLGDHFTQFSPTLDLSVYARVHLTQNFSVHFGYDYMLTGSVYRAYDNIAYLSPTSPGTDAPTIGLTRDRSTMTVHGIMIGGQWDFY